MASSGFGQRPDDQIDPALDRAASNRPPSSTAAGQANEADDLLETALAVDPRNRAAYVALGRVAQKQRLPGKAIRLSNKALRLEPNDVDALAARARPWSSSARSSAPAPI